MDAAERSTWEDVFAARPWGRWPSEAVVRAVKGRVRAGGRVLEVGCGAGAQLRFLEDEGYESVGVDFTTAALDQAVSLLTRLGVPRRVVQGDARALPFPSGSFDGVIDVETFTCLPDKTPAWCEAHRVLRTGGVAVSVAFTDQTDVALLAATGGAYVATPDGVAASASAAGFTVADQYTIRRSFSDGTAIDEVVTVALHA